MVLQSGGDSHVEVKGDREKEERPIRNKRENQRTAKYEEEKKVSIIKNQFKDLIRAAAKY